MVGRAWNLGTQDFLHDVSFSSELRNHLTVKSIDFLRFSLKLFSDVVYKLTSDSDRVDDACEK